jgi:hypothetical protein
MRRSNAFVTAIQRFLSGRFSRPGALAWGATPLAAQRGAKSPSTIFMG